MLAPVEVSGSFVMNFSRVRILPVIFTKVKIASYMTTDFWFHCSFGRGHFPCLKVLTLTLSCHHGTVLTQEEEALAWSPGLICCCIWASLEIMVLTWPNPIYKLQSKVVNYSVKARCKCDSCNVVSEYKFFCLEHV